MRINPFLSFDGQCDAAIKFYEEALGARVLFKMTWGGSPMATDVPAEARELIMHSTLAVGDGRIMCADALPGRYERPAGMSVSLHVTDAGEGERIFRALSENGEVMLPYGRTFWSRGFGMCVDRFGIPWIVNCEQEP
jgi:PhnB protein